MKERTTRPASIGEVLGSASGRLNMSRRIRLYEVQKCWPDIVGEMVAVHAQPSDIKGQTLVVRVAHSTWMQELVYLKPQVEERLAAALPAQRIKRIRFEQGDLPMEGISKTGAAARSSRALNADELEFIERAAEQIADQEIRDAARRAMQRGFATTRTREPSSR